MDKRIGVVVVCVAVLGVLVASPATSYAADMGMGGAKWTLSVTKDYTPSPWTKEMGYSNRAIGKLGFGVKNLLLGWTDLFTETKKATDGGENFFMGLGHGLKDAVENELGGAVHLVTFPITSIDAPLPDGGTQILNQ